MSGGCRYDRKPDGMPPLHICTVHVLLDGKPLQGAIVTLMNDTPWGAGGETDAKGKVHIATRGFPGCPEGEFKVIVSKTEFPPVLPQDKPEFVGDKPIIHVHEKFGFIGSTPLSCTVKPGKNEFSFEVEGPGRGMRNLKRND